MSGEISVNSTTYLPTWFLSAHPLISFTSIPFRPIFPRPSLSYLFLASAIRFEPSTFRNAVWILLEKPRQSRPRAKPLASSSDRRVREQWHGRIPGNVAVPLERDSTAEMGKLLRHLAEHKVLSTYGRRAGNLVPRVTSRHLEDT